MAVTVEKVKINVVGSQKGEGQNSIKLHD